MRKKWFYGTCYEEAKKYNSRCEFEKCSSGAYAVARKNKWLNDYVWFDKKRNPKGYWTRERCFEEATKYNSKSEFKKCSGSAYAVSCENGWLDDYVWFVNKQIDIIKDNIDSVYVYEFKEQNCAYVGRTLMYRQDERHKEHISNIEKDAVAKFAYENNIAVPKPIYLAENLTLAEGVCLEGYWEKKYREDGWTMLNRAKTGSVGTIGRRKWTRKACYEEAKKYSSRGEFNKKNKSAYNSAYKNGWLDDYVWFAPSASAKKWNYETCCEEAKKYPSRNEFKKGSSGAYTITCQNKWMDEFFPKKNKKVA